VVNVSVGVKEMEFFFLLKNQLLLSFSGMTSISEEAYTLATTYFKISTLHQHQLIAIDAAYNKVIMVFFFFSFFFFFLTINNL